MLRRRILQKIRSGVIIIGAMTLAVSFPLLLLPVTAAEKDDDIGNNDIGDGYNYYEKYPGGGCSKSEYRQVETIPVENVLREGQKLFGDTGKRSPFFPCWLDLELFRTGQKFARDNYGQVSFAHMLGIISLLANEQSRRILYSTHRSNTPEKSLKRYTATALHVYIWYNMDIFSPTWVKSVRNIRHIHRGVSAYMGSLYGNNATAYRATKNVRKEEEAEYTPDEDLWKAFELDLASSKYGRLMRNQSLFRDNSTFKHDPKHLYNQYLMSLTQWSFVALPILFPEEITIPRWTDKELLGYAHLWAVISYVLGMDERYILCKNPKDLQGCKKYLRDMLEMYLIPSLFNMDFQGKVLIESLLSVSNFLCILMGQPRRL